jgi:hypothetical protein
MAMHGTGFDRRSKNGFADCRAEKKLAVGISSPTRPSARVASGQN